MNDGSKFGKHGWKIKAFYAVCIIIVVLIVAIAALIASNKIVEWQKEEQQAAKLEDVNSEDSAVVDKDTEEEDNYPTETTQVENSENAEVPNDEIKITDEEETEESIHRYEYIVKDCTWKEALKDCKQRGGYLVRIESKKEYKNILKEIEDNGLDNVIFFIGARRDKNSYDYYWIDADNQTFGEKINTDEYWCKNEWLEGEPSFSDGGVEERYLNFFYYKDQKEWVWNDVPNNIIKIVSSYAGRVGYICEYEE